MTAPDIDAIVRGLTEAQRDRLMSFRQEPRQMGIGMLQFLPDMVAADGINHPIFGSHYRLTPIGLQVQAHLKEQAS